MAGPYLWLDDLARRGWLPLLSASELRLLWAVGVFYMRSSDDARADSQTLRAVTGLSESAFHEARNRLVRRALIRAVPGTRQGKFRAYRVTVYRFASPIPQAPTIPPERRRDTTATTPPQRSQHTFRAEQRLRAGGVMLPPNPAPDAATDRPQTLVRTQLVREVISSGSSSLAVGVGDWYEDLLDRFPSADRDAVLRELARAVRAVRQRPQTIEDASRSLARRLQSLSVLTWEREVLDRLQAIAGLPRVLIESDALDLDPAILTGTP